MKNSNLATTTWPGVSIVFSFLLLFGTNLYATESLLENPQKIAENEIELMFINREVKLLLDANIRPLKGKTNQIYALHELLFDEGHQNIRYDFRATKTAQQTFDSKSGNCLSLATLFVASARYLNLNAEFQKIVLPNSWQQEKRFYLVPGHVNVVLRLPGMRTATVEFVDVELDRHNKLTKRKIPDRHIYSDYLNNLGAEALKENNIATAIPLFEKAIATWRKSEYAWSNLGVSYKLKGDLEKAETAYKKALDIKPRNMTVINNLYWLYRAQGRHLAADKYLHYVERHSKKNPYNLYKLATTDLANGNYKQAERTLKKAIRIKKDEPDFYHALAKVYIKTDMPQAAKQQLEQARDVALIESEQQRFQFKLDSLTKLYGSKKIPSDAKHP